MASSSVWDQGCHSEKIPGVMMIFFFAGGGGSSGHYFAFGHVSNSCGVARFLFISMDIEGCFEAEGLLWRGISLKMWVPNTATFWGSQNPLPLQLPLFSSKPSSPASKSSLERQANGFLVKSQLFIQIEISEHQLSLRNPHTKLEVLDIFPPHVQAIESLNSCTVNANWCSQRLKTTAMTNICWKLLF